MLSLALLWTFCHLLDWKRSPARSRAQVGQAVSHDLRVSGPSTFVPGLSYLTFSELCPLTRAGSFILPPHCPSPLGMGIATLIPTGKDFSLSSTAAQGTPHKSQRAGGATMVLRALRYGCTSVKPLVASPQSAFGFCARSQDGS